MSLIFRTLPLATATELAALTQKVAANAAIAAAAAAANATSIQALAAELGLDEAADCKADGCKIALTPTPTPTPGPAYAPLLQHWHWIFVLGKTLYDAAGYEVPHPWRQQGPLRFDPVRHRQ